MSARFLMFQGTGSDVGKSLLTAGLCRWFARRGLRVRPFKPQNMSNNAAVAADGGEIGRAQALQARACGVAPSVHMNPVLLKPQTDKEAQIVVQGKVVGGAGAREWQALKSSFLPTAVESFERLRSEADLVLIEGAGSPAEVNLRRHDIANMGFAEAVQTPVILIGDIDRGGVIAALVGTYELLSDSERRLVRGFLINKFRGDPSLFEEGLDIVARRTGWPSFGVIPYLSEAALLPAEDAQVLASVRRGGACEAGKVHIVVPLLSRIANFDDFDPLAQEPGVTLTMVPAGSPLPKDADIVVLPGSKATIGDLAFLRAQGWDIDIKAHVRHGGHVLGVCGGYQMLGRRIADPEGLEGPPGESEGLGLLETETVLRGEKKLFDVAGTDCRFGTRIRGYEMHMGVTTGRDCRRPTLRLDDGRADGATSSDGRISGGYVHGLFAADGFREAMLRAFGGGAHGVRCYEATIEGALDALAERLDHVGRALAKRFVDCAWESVAGGDVESGWLRRRDD